jgi:hypothetical protein
MRRQPDSTPPDHLATPASGLAREARKFWRLSERELEQLLALAREADTSELKLVVPEAAREQTCDALGIDLARLPVRLVYFLDTPDLALDRHGVVVRVRSIERKPDDSVVKLRPVDPGGIPAKLRSSEEFAVEIDGMPGGYICSGTLKTRLGLDAVRRAMAGERSLRALFSKQQLALLADHAPPGVGIDDLTILGPIEVRRTAVAPSGLDRALTVQLWTYPDGSSLLELSTRCPADQTLQVVALTAAVLQEHGVGPARAQQTKTQATLDFFCNPRRPATSGR